MVSKGSIQEANGHKVADLQSEVFVKQFLFVLDHLYNLFPTFTYIRVSRLTFKSRFESPPLKIYYGMQYSYEIFAFDILKDDDQHPLIFTTLFATQRFYSTVAVLRCSGATTHSASITHARIYLNSFSCYFSIQPMQFDPFVLPALLIISNLPSHPRSHVINFAIEYNE
jgi:hypothetical protein